MNPHAILLVFAFFSANRVSATHLLGRQVEICESACSDIITAAETCSNLGCVCTAYSAQATACSSCLNAQKDPAQSFYGDYLTAFLQTSCQPSFYAQVTQPCDSACQIAANGLDVCSELSCLCTALKEGMPACTSCLLGEKNGVGSALAGYLTVILTSSCVDQGVVETGALVSTVVRGTGTVGESGLTTTLNLVTSLTAAGTGATGGSQTTTLTVATSSTQKSGATFNSYSLVQIGVSLFVLLVASVLLVTV